MGRVELYIRDGHDSDKNNNDADRYCHDYSNNTSNQNNSKKLTIVIITIITAFPTTTTTATL